MKVPTKTSLNSNTAKYLFGLQELRQVIQSLVGNLDLSHDTHQKIVKFMYNNLSNIKIHLRNGENKSILKYEQLGSLINRALNEYGCSKIEIVKKSISFDITDIYPEMSEGTNKLITEIVNGVDVSLNSNEKDVGNLAKEEIIQENNKDLKETIPNIDFKKIKNAQTLSGRFESDCVKVRELFKVQGQLAKRKDFSLNSGTAKTQFNELNRRNNDNSLLEKFENEVNEIKGLANIHTQTLKDFDHFLNTTVAALIKPYSLLYLEGVTFFLNNDENINIIKYAPELQQIPGKIISHLEEKKEKGIANLKTFYSLISKIDNDIEKAKQKAILKEKESKLIKQKNKKT